MMAKAKVSSKIKQLLPEESPRSLGFSMPAEWELHQGTWFSWPHNLDTWKHYLPTVEKILIEAVALLSHGETVHINVLNEIHRAHVEGLFIPGLLTDNVHFHCFPTNDAWCRDHGAMFVLHRESQELAGIDWLYNAWGEKYPPFDFDNAIAEQMCTSLDVRRFSIPVILEGGSVDVNGAGTLLTTETCLLHPNRNPGFDKSDLEFILWEMLNVEEVIWLSGELAGDDTDGHIDNLARFVDPNTIVIPVEQNVVDENAISLQKNLDRLKNINAGRVTPFNIIELPMPAPLYIDKRRMPANYINFYIGNEVVLMPAYKDENDNVAQEILQSCFKDRRVVRVNCSELIWGLGALHCLTQQVPDPLVTPSGDSLNN